jgi:hypothetical protein
MTVNLKTPGAPSFAGQLFNTLDLTSITTNRSALLQNLGEYSRITLMLDITRSGGTAVGAATLQWQAADKDGTDIMAPFPIATGLQIQSSNEAVIGFNFHKAATTVVAKLGTATVDTDSMDAMATMSSGRFELDVTTAADGTTTVDMWIEAAK